MTDYFQIGEQASQSKFVAILQTLRDQGQAILNQLETAHLNSLVEFNRRLQAMTARQQRALRSLSPQVEGLFPVSDLLSIDQTQTTATVRIDSQAASLRERTQPLTTAVKSQAFTSSIGSTQILDLAEKIYQVVGVSTPPTGQFDIELSIPSEVNVLSILMVPTPALPAVVVTVSSDGVNYLPATQVAVSSSTATAWLPSLTVRFVRILVTPTHPDTLGGTSYTFGITSFSAQAAAFFLRSELISREIDLVPGSAAWSFVADASPDISYFLSLQDGPYIEVNPGDTVAVPGTAVITAPGVAIDSAGLLAHTLGATAYFNTLLVTQQALLNGIVQQVPIPIVADLSPTDVNITALTQDYIAVTPSSGLIHLVSFSTPIDIGRTFNVSYVTGPALVTALLKVRLSTEDKTKTPVFHGASLQEI
jgi:hypothetical protein